MQTGHTWIVYTEWTWQAQSMRKSAFHVAGASLWDGGGGLGGRRAAGAGQAKRHHEAGRGCLHGCGHRNRREDT